MSGGVWQHNIVDEEGNVIPQASVEVRHQSSGALASIYSDYELTTTVDNPLTADNNGFVRFFASSGLYRITATSDGFIREWVYTPIGPLLDTQLAADIDEIGGSVEDQAQEIADNLAAIDAAGEAILENQVRLFLLGEPDQEYTGFFLNAPTVFIEQGSPPVTLLEYFETLEEGNTTFIESLSLLGAKNGAGTAFVLDTTSIKVDSDAGDSLATTLSGMAAAIDGNSSAIASEAITRANEDGALSSLITALDSRVEDAEGDISSAQVTIAAHTSAITDAESDITSLEARYGVTLNVGGYITGFAQHNDGSTGTFDILTDKFRVVDPASGGQNPKQVFTISGGNVHLQNLVVNGSLLVNGSVGEVKIENGAVTANKISSNAVTADKINVSNLQAVNTSTGALSVTGNLTMGTGGAIRQGKTSYSSSTAGFWIGNDSGTPRFNIGDSSNHLKWTGSVLEILGNVQMTNAASTFTPSWTGFSSAPSGDLSYIDFGTWVMLFRAGSALTGTSNATTMTITNLPSAIRPSSDRFTSCFLVNNSAPVMGAVAMANSATVTFLNASNFPTGAFSGSGSKGVREGWLITYPK